MTSKIFYVTKVKLQELKKEYDELLASEHNKVLSSEAPKILESEDLNPEFVSFQEDMDSMRLRMDELKDILENHEIIKKPSKENQTFVNVGATVKLEANGKKDEFMIVGTLDADPNLGRISNESPIGKALLGQKVGSTVEVQVPAGKTTYKILAIE